LSLKLNDKFFEDE
jgi:hypothetical protein